MNEQKKPLVPAIVCGTYPTVSETFVRRHVENLFEGRSVVVANKVANFGESNTPFFDLCSSRASGQGAKILRHILNVCSGKPYAALSPTAKEALKGFLKEHKVTVILVEFGTLAGIVSEASEELDIPLFVYFRGADATKGPRRWYVRWSLTNSLENAKAIFAVSKFLLDQLQGHGIRHQHSYVFPSGVDTALFHPSEKDPLRLLFVGRLVRKKAPLLTIEAFGRLAKHFPSASLHVVGDGPLYNSAKDLIDRLSLNNRVTLYGARDHGFVRDQMAKSGVLLQHSVTAADGDAEGLPSAVQEGMASGCAIVASRHAGIPEIIKCGVNGLLVDEGDVQGYESAICRLLSDFNLQKKMGSCNRSYAVSELDCWRIQERVEAAIRFHSLNEKSKE